MGEEGTLHGWLLVLHILASMVWTGAVVTLRGRLTRSLRDRPCRGVPDGLPHPLEAKGASADAAARRARRLWTAELQLRAANEGSIRHGAGGHVLRPRLLPAGDTQLSAAETGAWLLRPGSLYSSVVSSGGGRSVRVVRLGIAIRGAGILFLAAMAMASAPSSSLGLAGRVRDRRRSRERAGVQRDPVRPSEGTDGRRKRSVRHQNNAVAASLGIAILGTILRGATGDAARWALLGALAIAAVGVLAAFAIPVPTSTVSQTNGEHREGEPIKIRFRGRDVTARPEFVSDPCEVEELLRKMMAASPRVASFVPFIGPGDHVDPDKLRGGIEYGFRIVDGDWTRRCAVMPDPVSRGLPACSRRRRRPDHRSRGRRRRRNDDVAAVI
jgi:hypothetical protein